MKTLLRAMKKLDVLRILRPELSKPDSMKGLIEAAKAEILAAIVEQPKLLYSDGNEAMVSVPGLFLCFPSNQINYALSFLDPMFDRGLIHFLAHALEPGATFVDVGANAGTFVALAARNVGATGTVISVEPNEDLAWVIRKNAFINGPLTPHQHHSVAVADFEGHVEFQKFRTDSRVSSVFHYAEDETNDQFDIELVPVKKVSSLIPSAGSKLVIKVDAEGAEFLILADLLANKNKLAGRNVTIVLEYAAVHFERAGKEPIEFVEMLRSHGLTAHFIHPNSGVLMPVQLSEENLHHNGNIAVVIDENHFEAALPAVTIDCEKLFKERLTQILQRNLDVYEVICECCGETLILNDIETKVARCMFTSLELERYVCSSCGVVFGPLSIQSCSPEELNKLYDLVYSFHAEGDSKRAQEQTFYHINPSVNDKVLNYACGDWTNGVQRLNSIGWQVWGYEPSQSNSSGRIFSHREELEAKTYDKLFSHNFLEHVQSPRAFFEECSSLLKPGGVMAHSTPCYDYVFEQSPFHLFFYTGSSVARLCEGTGFSVLANYTNNKNPEQLGERYECRVYQRKCQKGP